MAMRKGIGLRSKDDARPILKWAGGKGQLLNQLSQYFPKALSDGSIHTYIEPFMGGGAVFFHIMQHYPIQLAFLRDTNPELVLLYQVVQREVKKLISLLGQMERDYLKLGEENRRKQYLDIRESFNRGKPPIGINGANGANRFSMSWVERAAQIIFMNKTCYNGLFRVNSKGKFNVPFGSYAKPTILDSQNLLQASSLLAKAEISLGDFEGLVGKAGSIKSGTFIYYDPPYRPISRTSNFKAYSLGDFDDQAQERLAKFFKRMDRRGIYQMLSNSDPKNKNPKDDFFENIFPDYKDWIYRIPASRSINSKGSSRGKINEIVIINYQV